MGNFCCHDTEDQTPRGGPLVQVAAIPIRYSAGPIRYIFVNAAHYNEEQIEKNVRPIPLTDEEFSTLGPLVHTGRIYTTRDTKTNTNRVHCLDMRFARVSKLPEDIGNLTMLRTLRVGSEIRSLPLSIGGLRNLTELDLSNNHHIESLPETFVKLVNLETLNLIDTAVQALPPSIGRLKRLRNLYISSTEIVKLSEEIGDLQALTLLYVRLARRYDVDPQESEKTLRIESLPASIGGLQNLETLDLSCNSNLLELPDEIGNLTNLKSLLLQSSNIAALPPSIGNLTNLELLNLAKTALLSQLPEEVGKLGSLEKLYLMCSGITSLPSSVQGLYNLRILNLYCTKNLERLPPEMGALTSLEILDLHCSGIVTLPDSIHRLHRLWYLDLWKCNKFLPTANDVETYLPALLRKCPSIGCLGHIGGIRCPKTVHALANNRARYRTKVTTEKLWPLVLSRAKRAFRRFPVPDAEELAHKSYQGRYKIKQADAIYRILVQSSGSASFAGLLIHRNSRSSKEAAI